MQAYVCIPSRSDKDLVAQFQAVWIPTYLGAFEKTLYCSVPSGFKLTEAVSSTNLTTNLRLDYQLPCAM